MDFKIAKIYFCFAVLFLVAKPFLGFTMFNNLHSTVDSNIFVKSFTKRTLEFSENSDLSVRAIQKKLAEPVSDFLLRFSFLLALLFPLLFGALNGATNRILQAIQLRLSPREHTYLLNSTLLI